jgi:hypothetical protein
MDKPKYCVCKHADFAHNGEGHQSLPDACDLCVCKRYRDREALEDHLASHDDETGWCITCTELTEA